MGVNRFLGSHSVLGEDKPTVVLKTQTPKRTTLIPEGRSKAGKRR
jgi:hypothetical protein